MMKKLLLILSAVLISGLVFSQEIESHKPMGRWSYNNLTKRIEKQKNDEKRMKKGVRIIKRKHISSNQVYKLSLLFSEEEYRLGFVKGAYPSITDKSNAIVVCDGFEKFSNQTILWEYIQAENKKYGIEPTDIASYQEYLEMKDRKKDKQYDKNDNKDKDLDIEKDDKTVIVVDENSEENNTETVKNPEAEKDHKTGESNNSIVFPDAESYTGINKGCDNYLDDKQFLAFANTVAQFEDDQEKATICMEYTHTYCFTTAQVMKLGVIISDEAARYIFFKTAYEKVYDKDNYLYVKQLLQNDKFIYGINNIYEVPQGEKPHPVSIEEEKIQKKCILSEEDFSIIKSEIRKETFSTTRLKTAKELIPQYNCISSKQVKDILGLLSLEDDKIELAKYAYEYTFDPQNYDLVRDYFTSQESRDEISKIMKK